MGAGASTDGGQRIDDLSGHELKEEIRAYMNKVEHEEHRDDKTKEQLITEVGKLHKVIKKLTTEDLVPVPGVTFPTAGMKPGTADSFTLVLMRHGESEWNKTNQFTGWYDSMLSPVGHEEAKAAGRLIKQADLNFDLSFTSVLSRAVVTCAHALEESDQAWVPTTKAWQLNERHYGGLTGLNKQETVDKHGKEQVLVWRRSYDVPPPPLESDHHYFNYFRGDRRYAMLSDDELPLCESLEMTCARVQPYWDSVIAPIIKMGQRVLIAAHGNSLRALIMALDGIGKEDIAGLNVPTGIPLVYTLDASTLKPVPHPDAIAPLSGYYLGNQEEIRAKIDGVKNQTK